jgi:hypothetical protein
MSMYTFCANNCSIEYTGIGSGDAGFFSMNQARFALMTWVRGREVSVALPNLHN